MPYAQIMDAVGPNWRKRHEDYLEQQRQFKPGIKAKKAIKDFTHQNINMPLYEKGWPNLGAVLSGLPNAAADIMIPETNEEALISAIPFSKFTKGADNALGSNAVGLLEPVEREKALKRINAWEAIRKALGKHKALKQDVKSATDLGDNVWWKDLEKKHDRLGGGVDMVAYDVDGVAVKSPRFHIAGHDLWDDAEASLRRREHALTNFAGHDPEYAKIVAKRDLDSARMQIGNDAKTRFLNDQNLHSIDIAPETFLGRAPNQAPYILQDRAEATLKQDLVGKPLAISVPLEEQVPLDLIDRADRAGMHPKDVHPANIGRFGPFSSDPKNHNYKLFDSGEFGDTPDINQADRSWRFIDAMRKK